MHMVETKTRLGLVVADRLAERAKTQHKVTEDKHQGKERWNPAFERGDYGIVTIIEGEQGDTGKDRKPEDLLNVEVFFIYLLETLRKVKPQTSPVVFMDLGGMMGLTTSRLANHFREQVEKGEYIFVVTNIAFNPESDSKDLSLSPDEMTFLESTRKLTHFVNGTTSQLLRKSFSTVQGEVKLKGNIDFLHEATSVTAHSEIPEIEVARLGHFLSPVGIYATRDNEVWGPSSDPDTDLRQTGLVIAHNILQNNFGLVKVDQPEVGPFMGRKLRYTFFRRPGAPLIEVNEVNNKTSLLS